MNLFHPWSKLFRNIDLWQNLKVWLKKFSNSSSGSGFRLEIGKAHECVTRRSKMGPPLWGSDKKGLLTSLCQRSKVYKKFQIFLYEKQFHQDIWYGRQLVQFNLVYCDDIRSNKKSFFSNGFPGESQKLELGLIFHDFSLCTIKHRSFITLSRDSFDKSLLMVIHESWT